MRGSEPAVERIEVSFHCLSSVQESVGVVPIIAGTERRCRSHDDSIKRLDRTRPLGSGGMKMARVVLAVGTLSPLAGRLNCHELRQLLLRPVPVSEAQEVAAVAQILSPGVSLVYRHSFVVAEPLNEQAMKAPS